ncbi:TM0106 family RecB-like putative nuclease [Salana multivorans]
MFLINGAPVWSASDLTDASECEYAVLRRLDYRQGWAEPIEEKVDPLMARVAVLGDRHETRVLAEIARRGAHVADLSRLPLASPERREAAADATEIALSRSGAEVVYQAALLEGDFFGVADFVERAEDGWLVADAKLARSAKPRALLQLGAYAEQLERLGVPVSARVALLLGNGQRKEFRRADVQPVFLDRRERLRQILAVHLRDGAGVEWGDSRFLACGRCPECTAAAEESDDLVLVAGLSMPQRRRLVAAGIPTLSALAGAATGPQDMTDSTFRRLRSQARLQQHRLSGEDSPVPFELTEDAAATLALLPAPSAGDLFFDFEGDPLFDDDGAAAHPGLEYLWGVTDASEQYTATWAHDSEQERRALQEFVDQVTQRHVDFPDLHVYHYAPYETTALKRLAMRYQTREEELDALLRAEVFVDLYATVRGSVRVGQPSYSIKKLEPLYMGEQLRSDEEDAVGDGGASVVAYHEYRELALSGEESAAERKLATLADYNAYDCLSTLRLRDWLLARAAEAGVRDQILPRTGPAPDHATTSEALADHPTFEALMERSGPDRRSERSPEEQACAMLAASLGYHRREQKQFWWEHFWRLDQKVLADWPEARDVFLVEHAEVLQDWAVPGPRARNLSRTTRLVGRWGASSRPGRSMHVVYERPFPPRSFGPTDATLTAAEGTASWPDESEPHIVHLTESRPATDTFDQLPVALTPGRPPRINGLEAATHEVGVAAAAAAGLPDLAVVDLLLRRPPRTARAALPSDGSPVQNIVAALTSMADSFLAVQGPPGAGKTYTGSRVVKELVERHGWRIGVVAQSHAVVENMLRAVVSAGLDPALVGKTDPKDRTRTEPPAWTSVPGLGPFLAKHAGTGCVVGGTQWDFVNTGRVQRGELDLLVIDEAGQFSLASTIAVSVAAKRLLLLGDPQQLPQVSQGTHAEPINESALGWLTDGHDTLPPELGYFLGETYRMHPDLTAVVSRLSYEDRLAAAAPAAARRLEGTAPGLHVVTVDHAGNQTESPEEAAEVVRQVRTLLGSTWVDPDDSATPRPLAPGDVLVVAPYNAQVSLIRAELRRAGLDGVRVGTVDRFQGQEAPVAIVSMTASSPADAPRGMGFLLNRNRINVAVSRAQWCAILIRSAALTSFMPASTEGFIELGGFIGLCGSAHNES